MKVECTQEEKEVLIKALSGAHTPCIFPNMECDNSVEDNADVIEVLSRKCESCLRNRIKFVLKE